MPAAANSPESYGGRVPAGSLGIEDRANLLDQVSRRVYGFGMKPCKPRASMLPTLACSANPLLRTTRTLGYRWLEFIEDRVAIHHRKKVIEKDEVDFLAHSPIDLEGFDSILRQDEAVILEIENLPGEPENILVVIDQKNELALAFGIENDQDRSRRRRLTATSPTGIFVETLAREAGWRGWRPGVASPRRTLPPVRARMRVVMRSKMACEAREASSS